MKTSKKGIEALIKEEGILYYAYYCQAGVKTIGIGMVIDYLKNEERNLLKKVDIHEIKQIKNIKPALESDGKVLTISKTDCEYILKEKLKLFERVINESVIINLTQNQFDALISFVFNIGINAFKRSTLLKKINKKSSYREIEKYFLVWNKSKGSVLEVLEKRRKREASMFLDNKY